MLIEKLTHNKKRKRLLLLCPFNCTNAWVLLVYKIFESISIFLWCSIFSSFFTRLVNNSMTAIKQTFVYTCFHRWSVCDLLLVYAQIFFFLSYSHFQMYGCSNLFPTFALMLSYNVELLYIQLVSWTHPFQVFALLRNKSLSEVPNPKISLSPDF